MPINKKTTKKKVSKKVDNTLIVHIGRFGSDTKTVEVENGFTINEILEEAGITLTENEVIWSDNGRIYRKDFNNSELFEDTEINSILLNIVSPKQAGI